MSKANKKYQKTIVPLKETTMTEEVNKDQAAVGEVTETAAIQDIDTAQSTETEVNDTSVEETAAPEVAPEVVVAETVAAKEILDEAVKTDPVDLGVKDETVVIPPAVNISAEMPQESDPIVDGSLEKLMETVTTAAPEVAPVVVVAAPEVAAPVIDPIVAADPAVANDAPSDKSEEEVYLDKIRVSGTVEQKRMLAAVETFVGQMKPRVEIEPSKGVVYQAEFLEHLLWLLKKDYELFRSGWNVLLIYFSLYHGVNSARSYTALSEFSTTRFLFAWTKGLDKCNCYRNLITLLRATRNKETRKHDIKTINLAFIGPNVLGENELNNLKQFYGV